jgi:hypothetical protein
MSGGSLDYSYLKIDEVVEKLQERLELENDYYVWVKPKIFELIKSLEIISNNLWQLEWYLDGDISSKQMEMDWK